MNTPLNNGSVQENSQAFFPPATYSNQTKTNKATLDQLADFDQVNRVPDDETAYEIPGTLEMDITFRATDLSHTKHNNQMSSMPSYRLNK